MRSRPPTNLTGVLLQNGGGELPCGHFTEALEAGFGKLVPHLSFLGAHQLYDIKDEGTFPPQWSFQPRDQVR